MTPEKETVLFVSPGIAALQIGRDATMCISIARLCILNSIMQKFIFYPVLLVTIWAWVTEVARATEDCLARKRICTCVRALSTPETRNAHSINILFCR